VWLEHNGRLISSLDIVPADSWTLVSGIGGDSWRDAAKQLESEVGLKIAIRTVGPGLDFSDVYGDWAAAREISDYGCLLVRPDKHIAWRAFDAIADPVTALRDVLQRILGDR
jgi:2,4-dichlorophenol 6-monooxygenase